MRDVTDWMRKFRTSACAVWNDFLFPGDEIYDGQVEASFEAIEKEMLRCTVFRDAPENAEDYRRRPLRQLLVMLNRNSAPPLPLYEGRKNELGTRTWNALEPAALPSECDHYFFELYDFYHYQKIAYEFVKVVGEDGVVRLFPSEYCLFLLKS